MARISDDASSWKAGGVQHRDFRHTHNGPEVPTRKGGRKNTRRWCKGIVGREHTIEVGIAAPRWNLFRSGAPIWIVDKCTTCGKEFNWRRNPNL